MNEHMLMNESNDRADGRIDDKIQAMTDELYREMNSSVSRAAVQLWDFLLNQDGLKQWFNAREFVIDVYEGGELKFTVERGGQPYRISGETGLLNQQKQLIITWIEQDRYGRSWFAPTNVSFQPLPIECGTRFLLIHSGFKYLPDHSQQEIHRQYQAYWDEVALPQLKSLVEAT